MNRITSQSNPVFNYVERFEGVRIYESRWMPKGSGIALPGIGIIISREKKSMHKRLSLLRHEFGHFLQARETGIFLFYVRVGIPSLLSAMRNGKRGHRHHEYWTEVWANQLAADYFRS